MLTSVNMSCQATSDNLDKGSVFLCKIVNINCNYFIYYINCNYFN